MAEQEKVNETVTLTKAELKKIVDDAGANSARLVAAELMAGVMSKGAGAPDAGMLQQMGEAIASAIAEMSDQGTNRKRVAPEVLQARAKAHQSLVKLLSEARDAADAARKDGDEVKAAAFLPLYRVVAKTYLTDQIIEPWRRGPRNEMMPTEVIWRGIPNNSLRPLNPIAKRVFELFIASIGTVGIVRAESSFMTPGGVTIVGDPRLATRRDLPDELRPADLEVVGGEFDPNATQIRVLGTIAEPARQNVKSRAPGFKGEDALARQLAARADGQQLV